MSISLWLAWDSFFKYGNDSDLRFELIIMLIYFQVLIIIDIFFDVSISYKFILQSEVLLLFIVAKVLNISRNGLFLMGLNEFGLSVLRIRILLRGLELVAS
jgi:hypothetical protein